VYTRRCTYKTTETSIKDMQSAPQLQFTHKLTGSNISDDGDGGDDGSDGDGDACKDDGMNSSDDELLYNAAQAYEEESARRPPPQTDGDVISDSDESDDGMNSSDDELLYNAAQAYEEESARRPSPQTDVDVIASDDGVDRTQQEQTTQPPPTGWYTVFTKRFKVC